LGFAALGPKQERGGARSGGSERSEGLSENSREARVACRIERGSGGTGAKSSNMRLGSGRRKAGGEGDRRRAGVAKGGGNERSESWAVEERVWQGGKREERELGRRRAGVAGGKREERELAESSGVGASRADRARGGLAAPGPNIDSGGAGRV
jgi:hypothetical protein